MKKLMPVLLLLATTSLFAQKPDSAWHQEKAFLTKQAYHKFRMHLSYPPYSFDKVNQLIKKQVLKDSDDNQVMRAKVYDGLSLREKFTYNMLHEEAFSQNCDASPQIEEERNRIFAYLPDDFTETASTWSDRQTDFFKNNRDSVIALMQECIGKTKKVGLNFKNVISLTEAKEMIPLLIKTYNIAKNDYDILTLLMLLMKDGEYKPFLASTSWKKLYGDDANYQSYLSYSKANEELIIKRATDFYNGVK